LKQLHVVENDVEELVQLVDFEEWHCEEETLKQQHVVQNDAEELDQLVDFRSGSVRRVT
jgi:hypothetical protein